MEIEKLLFMIFKGFAVALILCGGFVFMFFKYPETNSGNPEVLWFIDNWIIVAIIFGIALTAFNLWLERFSK